MSAASTLCWFRPAPHIVDLLGLLGGRTSAADLSLEQWDVLVRTARRLRLLGTVAYRLRADSDQWAAVPGPVRAHFESALTTLAFRRQKVLLEMDSVRQALSDPAIPIVLLKGAAYIAQNLPLAHQRLVGDLDLLVDRDRLDEVETRLIDSGWESLKPDPYDQKYYRDWSHELPPMQLPGHALELDVHHNILPPTGRLHPQAAQLIRDAIPLEEGFFRVPHPADQVLHAAVHLFQDSDCLFRARDLVDIDELIRNFGQTPSFWDELISHARVHGIERPLWYALDCGVAIFDTPVPNTLFEKLNTRGPGYAARTMMRLLLPKVLFTEHPERTPAISERVARWLLFLRSFWLRMPLGLLLLHSAMKLIRNFRKTSERTE
ncbi:MAG TPA: nucleotidyltransferase family protein [Burkholderiales bacterium]|nr:nucleotidyltransferase family protein [Burkholderiales bacterium]